MDSREKISRALAHRGGPVPLDIGATSSNRGSYINCRKAKRILWPGKTSGASDGAAPDAAGTVDEDLKQAMGIDTTQIWNPNTIFGFRDEGSKDVADSLGAGYPSTR